MFNFLCSRLLAVAVCAAVCCAFTAADVAAQNNYQQPNPQRKKSALEKLSELNRKVKRSIRDSLFGDIDQEDQFDRRYVEDQRGPLQQPVRTASGDYRSARAPQNSNLYQRPVAMQTQYQQEVELNSPPQPEADPRTRSNYTDRGGFDSRNYQTPNGSFSMDHRDPQQGQYDRGQAFANRLPPVQQSAMRAPQGEHYGARSGMPELARPQENWNVGIAPAPLPLQQHPSVTFQQQQQQQPIASTPQASQNQNGEYRAGHYQNVDGLTQQQLDHQETATQRVMRLYAENQSLLEERRSMQAQNKLLRQQLSQKTQLLSEIEKAIESARKELQVADQQNSQLKKQVLLLQDEKERQLVASNRQLNSIRKKLDDVLMIEMTSQ